MKRASFRKMPADAGRQPDRGGPGRGPPNWTSRSGSRRRSHRWTRRHPPGAGVGGAGGPREVGARVVALVRAAPRPARGTASACSISHAGRYIVESLDTRSHTWVSCESAAAAPLVIGVPFTGRPVLVMPPPRDPDGAGSGRVDPARLVDAPDGPLEVSMNRRVSCRGPGRRHRRLPPPSRRLPPPRATRR